MLPLTLSLASVDVVAVEIVVTVKIIIVVDGDVPAVPVAIAPVPPSPAPRCSQCKSGAPSQSHPRHISWIIVGVIRIGRRSSAIHYDGIIRRDVNDVRIRLLDDDDLLAALDRLGLHFLLRVGL